MKKNYLIVVVAHSVHGRIRRLHIPHYAIHVVLCLALFGAVTGVGMLSSYARMFWKVTQFNELRTEKEALQRQNQELKRTVEERDIQLASLGELASAVSIAFGIKRPMTEQAGSVGHVTRPANYRSFMTHYDFLQQVQLSPQVNGSLVYLANTVPSVWPVQGQLSSSFGKRLDPFLGEGAFHSGVDLRAPWGTPVVAAADGIVRQSGWRGPYGRLIVLNHGNDTLSTLYAHLSELFVRAGQVVRRGEVIGRVGSTGRTTSPHLHYEVRYRGTPVNPYKYLKNSTPDRSTFRAAD